MLELEIPNKDYDFLGMAGLISEYCRKNQVSSILENRTQLAFEELVEQILKRTTKPTRIQAVMEYSEAQQQMTLILRFSGPKPEGANDPSSLSIKLLKIAVSAAEYSREEESDLPNRLVLHIRNEENEMLTGLSQNE